MYICTNVRPNNPTCSDSEILGTTVFITYIGASTLLISFSSRYIIKGVLGNFLPQREISNIRMTYFRFKNLQ